MSNISSSLASRGVIPYPKDYSESVYSGGMQHIKQNRITKIIEACKNEAKTKAQILKIINKEDNVLSQQSGLFHEVYTRSEALALCSIFVANKGYIAKNPVELQAFVKDITGQECDLTVIKKYINEFGDQSINSKSSMGGQEYNLDILRKNSFAHFYVFCDDHKVIENLLKNNNNNNILKKYVTVGNTAFDQKIDPEIINKKFLSMATDRVDMINILMDLTKIEDISDDAINHIFILTKDENIIQRLVNHRLNIITKDNINSKFVSLINSDTQLKIIAERGNDITPENINFKFLSLTYPDTDTQYNIKFKKTSTDICLAILHHQANKVDAELIKAKFNLSDSAAEVEEILKSRGDCIDDDMIKAKAISCVTDTSSYILNRTGILKHILSESRSALNTEYINYLIYLSDESDERYESSALNIFKEIIGSKVIQDLGSEFIEEKIINKFVTTQNHLIIEDILNTNPDCITDEQILSKYKLHVDNSESSQNIRNVIYNYLGRIKDTHKKIISIQMLDKIVVQPLFEQPQTDRGHEIHNYTANKVELSLTIIDKLSITLGIVPAEFTVEDLRSKIELIQNDEQQEKAQSALNKILESEERTDFIANLPKIAVLLNNDDALWKANYKGSDTRWIMWLKQSFVESGIAYEGNKDTTGCSKGIYERLFTGFRGMHSLFDYIFTAKNVADGYNLNITNILSEEKDNVVSKLKEPDTSGRGGNFKYRLLMAYTEIIKVRLSNDIEDQLELELSQIKDPRLDELKLLLMDKVKQSIPKVLYNSTGSNKFIHTIDNIKYIELATHESLNLDQYITNEFYVNLKSVFDALTPALENIGDEKFVKEINSIAVIADKRTILPSIADKQSILSRIEYLRLDLIDRNQVILDDSKIKEHNEDVKSLLEDKNTLIRLESNLNKFKEAQQYKAEEKINFNFYKPGLDLNPSEEIKNIDAIRNVLIQKEYEHALIEQGNPLINELKINQLKLSMLSKIVHDIDLHIKLHLAANRRETDNLIA